MTLRVGVECIGGDNDGRVEGGGDKACGNGGGVDGVDDGGD